MNDAPSRGVSPTRIRVLILEDNPSDAELMMDALRQAGLDPEWERVETEADFASRLTPKLDLILSDYTLPQMNGVQALQLVRSRGLDVPFILVSGSIGEDIAVEAMRHGADDYLLKDRMARLGSAVLQSLEKRRLRAEGARAESARRESEERFRQLAENIHEVFYLMNATGTEILYVSPAYETVWGQAREGLYGNAHAWIDAIHPDDRPLVIEEFNKGLSSGEYDFEYRIVRPDGSLRWIHDRAFPVRAARGELHRIAGVAEDITERRLAEEKIEKLSRIRALSSAINSLIVRVRGSKDLFDEACRIAVEHGKFRVAWIGTYDAKTFTITPAASAGFEDNDFLAREKLIIREDAPQGSGMAGIALRERRAVHNNDITANAGVGGKRRQEAIRRGYRSAIALPLIVGGEPFGNFSLFAAERDFFDDEEVALLAELAGNISFALDRMKTEEKIGKLSRIRNVMSEINAAIVRVGDPKTLFEETCRIAVEHGKFAMSWIAEIDVARKAVRAAAWHGFTAQAAQAVTWDRLVTARGTLLQAIETRQVSVRNRIAQELAAGTLRQQAMQHGCRSSVTLPLVVDERVVAIVSLFAREENFFDAEELVLLQEVASDLSFTLQSLAREQKIAKLSRIRIVLGEINAAIVRIPDRQKLFEETCRIVADDGRIPFVWIGTYHQDARQVRPVAWAGAMAAGYLDTIRAARPVDDSMSRTLGSTAIAVTRKQAVIVNDVQNDPRILRKEMHLEHGTRSLAVLPLIVAGEVAGVIALHAGETGFFDAEETALLGELAGDIGLALQTITGREQLDYLAYYDPLTGLPNRSLFIDRVGQQMHARSDEPRMVALLLLNLERFRHINDSYGRHGGDEILKQVALRLGNAFHGNDFLARIGADTFGVVMRGIPDTANAVRVVENQVFGCFREPYTLNGSELRIAAKAGIAIYPGDGENADALFRNAEAALKKVHDTGERHLFYAADMNARAAQVLSLETRLRKAVETQQFVLYYQPKIILASGEIHGLEALIRWQEPGRGLVPPVEFIPMLEETGLILEVGKWVIERALADHCEWTARGCRAPRIAVNVSAIQLRQAGFTDVVIDAVQKHGDIPDALELEITESLLMKDVHASIRKLSILRGMGIQVSMDDFGTGYSSLAYIARLPINSVKIDRSFIAAVPASSQDMAIVAAIITLARSLNLKVIAEGVETEEQAQTLRLLKCDEAQGFLYSRPVPAAEIEVMLRAAPLPMNIADSARPTGRLPPRKRSRKNVARSRRKRRDT